MDPQRGGGDMKMFGRRSFLRALGAAPLAGRAAAEAVAKELGQIGSIGVAGACTPLPSGLRETISGQPAGLANAMTGSFTSVARRKMMEGVLADKESKDEINSILYLCHRNIHHLDHDIGSKQSWSLAAKITFQRQRLVATELEVSVVEATPWQDMRGWVENKLKRFVIG